MIQRSVSLTRVALRDVSTTIYAKLQISKLETKVKMVEAGEEGMQQLRHSYKQFI